MNAICKVIWSHVHQQMVVVSELGAAGGKTHSSRSTQRAANPERRLAPSTALQPKALCAALALGLGLTAAQAQVANTALPTGASVAAGTAHLSQSGASLVIDQGSPRAVINWQSFNVGKDAQVQFNNGSGSTLNRVLGPEASTILGRINATGQVIISNGNGVFFGAGSRVDVGSLVATTLSISDGAFMAGGDLRFERHGATGSVVNEGELSASLQGYVALLAPEVRNSGVVVASKGTVALAAGEAITLQLNGNDQLQGVVVEAGDWQALVDNRHVVEAEGGWVILSARAMQSVQGGVVRHSGRISASSLTEVGGRILLTGDDITLAAGSSTTATGATGGGQVLVGGDWQGGRNAERRVFADPHALHQATTVTMEQGAAIDASATDHGKGGTVVLWSDVTKANSVTTASGSIYAKGGATGGDGGQIETSGGLLVTDGLAGSAAAPKGKAGEWLFDPTNIVIGDGGTALAGSGSVSSSASTITAASISSLLSGGTAVSVMTSGEGAQNGDINIGSSITKSGGGDASLTLKATGTISTDSDVQISSTTGKLNVVFWSDSGTNGSGGISLGAGTQIKSLGGHVVLAGGSDDGVQGGTASDGIPDGDAKGSRGVNILGNTLIDAGGGDITIRGMGTASEGVRILSSGGDQGSKILTTGAGRISIIGSSTGTGVNAEGISLGQSEDGTGVLIQTQHGDIQLTATGGTFNFDSGQSSSTSSIGLNIHRSAIQSTGNGSIHMTGTGPNGNADNDGVNLENGTLVATGWNGSTASGSGGIVIIGVGMGDNGEGIDMQDTPNNRVLAGSGGVILDGRTTAGDGTSVDIKGDGATPTIDSIGGSITIRNGANNEGGRDIGVSIDTAWIGSEDTTAVTIIGKAVSDGGIFFDGVRVRASGDIQINGTGSGDGVHLEDVDIRTVTSGHILIEGSSTSSGDGIESESSTGNVVNNFIEAAGSGTVTLTGRTASTDSSDRGVELDDIEIASQSGNISLIGESGAGTAVSFSENRVSLTSTSGHILLRGNSVDVNGTNNVLTTSGKLTMESSGTTFTSPVSLTNVAINSINELLVGKSSNTADIILGAYTVAGPVSLLGGNITISGALAATDASLIADGDIKINADMSFTGDVLLKAKSNIAVAADGVGNTNVTLQTEGGEIDFWSDSDANGQGSIALGRATHTSQGLIKSNGGNITLGGGSDLSTGFAMAGAEIYPSSKPRSGVAIFGYTLDAMGGNISIRGDGSTSSASTRAVLIEANAGHRAEIKTDGSGTVSIVGDASRATGSNPWGIAINSVDITTAEGEIALTGKANTGVGNARGMALSNFNFTSTAGDLTLTDVTDGSAANYTGAYINASSGSTMTAGTDKRISIIADEIFFDGADKASTWFKNGDVVVNPYSGTSFTGALTLQKIKTDTSTSLVVGEKNGLHNTADVTVAAGTPLTVDGMMAIYGGNITLNSALTATNNNITLQGTGNVTQGTADAAAGALTANNLRVLGGAVTLSNASNNVGMLAASGVESLTYVDSNDLIVGTVENTEGVSANQAINIQTISNDLTVDKNISTTSTANNAVILNASSGTSIASAAPAEDADSDGDIKITQGASISTGAQGRVLLYTGSMANSTGVSAAAGGGNLRYGSDETTTRFVTALGDSDTYAIYREAPSAPNGTYVYGDVLGLKVGSYTATTFTDLGYSGGGNVTITARPITLTADASQGKVYGEADPTLSFTPEANSSGRGLVGSDTFTGALERDTGEDVGSSYAITQGSLDNSNYAISFTGANFAITARPITLTADAGQSKVYGDTDPTLSFTPEANSSGRGLVAGDTFTGALERATGETVGSSYAITQGSLDNSNYAISFTGDNFAITARPITLTADAGQSKVYGDTDPTLSYTPEANSSGRGLVAGDTFTGAMVRATGESVGSGYAITQGSLDNSNYAISFTGANFAITQRPITLTADASQGKVYGDTDPTLSFTPEANSSGRGLVAGDTFTGALERDTGEDVGSGYAITQGSLDNSNYAISFTGDNFAISPMPVEITIDRFTKKQRDPDPQFGFVADPALDDADLADFVLTREPGDRPGTYRIAALNPNFAVTVRGDAVLEIEAPPTQSVAEIANAVASNGVSKAATNLSIASVAVDPMARVSSAGVKVELVQQPALQSAGLVTVSVPADIATSSAGLAFALPNELLEAISNAVNMEATLVGGEPLPAWLRFDNNGGQFVLGDVGDVSFPIELNVQLGTQAVTVVISEQQN